MLLCSATYCNCREIVSVNALQGKRLGVGVLVKREGLCGGVGALFFGIDEYGLDFWLILFELEFWVVWLWQVNGAPGSLLV